MMVDGGSVRVLTMTMIESLCGQDSRKFYYAGSGREYCAGLESISELRQLLCILLVGLLGMPDQLTLDRGRDLTDAARQNDAAPATTSGQNPGASPPPRCSEVGPAAAGSRFGMSGKYMSRRCGSCDPVFSFLMPASTAVSTIIFISLR